MKDADAFNHVNDFVREYILMVLDYAELWPYFDPKPTRKLPTHKYTRPLYGRAWGIKRTMPITLPSPTMGPMGLKNGREPEQVRDWVSGGKYCQATVR